MTQSAKNRSADHLADVPAAGPPAPDAAKRNVPPELRALRIFAGAGVLGVLLVAAALYRYPHAMADDYSYAGRTRLYGAAGAVAYDYKYHTGRWACIGSICGLWSLSDLSDPWKYRTALIVVAVLCAAAFHFFVCTVMELRFLALRAIALTLAFLAVYWAGMLAPGEGLCWLSAVLGYQTGSAGILFVIAALMRCARAGPGAGHFWLMASAIAAAVVPGTNELLGLVLCMVLGAGVLVAMWKRSASRWAWLIVAAAAVIGLAVVAAAPGNAVRRAQFPRSMDFAWAFHFMILQLWHFLIIWMSDGRLWAATFLLVLAPASAVPVPAWLRQGGIRWLFWIPVTWAVVMAAVFFVPAFATGDSQPYRAFNFFYFAFLIGWFLTVLALRARLARDDAPAPRDKTVSAWLPAAWLGLLMGVFVAVMGFTPIFAGRGEPPNMGHKGEWPFRPAMSAAWLIAFFLLAVWLRSVWRPAARTRAVAVLLATWPAALLLTGNAPHAWGDLTEKQSLPPLARTILEPRAGPLALRAPRTRLEWLDLQMSLRRQFLREHTSAGRRYLCVPPIFPEPDPRARKLQWPQSFLPFGIFSDLSPDPRDWKNSQMCPFFGLPQDPNLGFIRLGPFEAR